MKKFAVTLFCLTAPLFAISDDKQALVHFEMGNYFFQGKDFDHALEYYKLAEGKITNEELSTVMGRNLATVYLIREDKKNAVASLEKVIDGADLKKITESQALRDVFKMYAEIKADEINPKIQDAKREAFQAQRQAQFMQMQQQMKGKGGNGNAPKPAAPKEKPAEKPGASVVGDGGEAPKVGF